MNPAHHRPAAEASPPMPASAARAAPRSVDWPHRRWHVSLAWLAATLAALLLFRAHSVLDLVVSATFHLPQAATPFAWGEMEAVQVMYRVVPWVGRLAFVVCLIVCLLPRASVARGLRLRWRRRALALVLVLMLGLLGAVNGVLKEHVGRPRPYTVQAFGGPHPYQRVGDTSPYCRHNCSFVSGHAATGFVLMACGLLGAPAVRRRWAWVGIGVGSLVGAGRVVQGGHFFSDIVFAGLVIGGVCIAVRVCWVRRRWWRRRRRLLPASQVLRWQGV